MTQSKNKDDILDIAADWARPLIRFQPGIRNYSCNHRGNGINGRRMGHFSSREPESLRSAVCPDIRGLQADYYFLKNTVKMSVCGQFKDWIQKIFCHPLKVTVCSIPLCR